MSAVASRQMRRFVRRVGNHPSPARLCPEPAPTTLTVSYRGHVHIHIYSTPPFPCASACLLALGTNVADPMTLGFVFATPSGPPFEPTAGASLNVGYPSQNPWMMGVMALAWNGLNDQTAHGRSE